MRIKPQNNEHYHIYNRGVDKRPIFKEKEDILRFLHSLRVFNNEDIGSIWERSHSTRFGSPTPKSEKKLVTIVAYCLNINHYHIIVEQVSENGISKFMQKVATGYTNYFNDKYERSGALFQGKYKSVHVDDNEQLLHLSVYVNLNDRVHGGLNPKWFEETYHSSWHHYLGVQLPNNDAYLESGNIPICDPSIILNQYVKKSTYEAVALRTLPEIIKRKEENKNSKKQLLE